MSRKYANLARQPVPQSEPLAPNQVKNNAGGYVFALDIWKRLDRFLILGSDSNTYYQKAQTLTRENTACVQQCYDADHARTVARIVEISQEGRAPKNDAAIYALALGAAHKDVHVRALALGALPQVCRTSTHLFQFVDNCRALGRGWGRALKRAVSNWYDSRTVDNIAYQAIKYRSREGYTHKRLLQSARWHSLSHPNMSPEYKLQRLALYKWMKGEPHGDDAFLPKQVHAHVSAMALKDNPKAVAKLVEQFNLPWEALPTEVTKDPGVWAAMLPHMGLTALIRNLGSMTSYGLLKPLARETSFVVEQLSNPALLRKARIHPFNVLLARAAYGSGRSRGGVLWEPVPAIVNVLGSAFYDSFKAIEPSGKRVLIGLDVSGSMSSPLMGTTLSVREGAAAMAMTVLRTEKNWHVHAFADVFRKLPLTPSMSLEQVLQYTRNVDFGGTDCSLPMTYAKEKGLDVDVFQVFTDNETWAGRSHPVKALQDYRKASGINAKLVVVGMTSTGFTIADPNDPGMLDVVGFDSAAPAVMAEFARS